MSKQIENYLSPILPFSPTVKLEIYIMQILIIIQKSRVKKFRKIKWSGRQHSLKWGLLALRGDPSEGGKQGIPFTDHKHLRTKLVLNTRKQFPWEVLKKECCARHSKLQSQTHSLTNTALSLIGLLILTSPMKGKWLHTKGKGERRQYIIGPDWSSALLFRVKYTALLKYLVTIHFLIL